MTRKTPKYDIHIPNQPWEGWRGNPNVSALADEVKKRQALERRAAERNKKPKK
jgi:hypothetical protein